MCQGSERRRHWSNGTASSVADHSKALGYFWGGEDYEALWVMMRNMDLHLRANRKKGKGPPAMPRSSVLLRTISLASVRCKPIGQRPSDQALGFNIPFVCNEAGQFAEQALSSNFP